MTDCAIDDYRDDQDRKTSEGDGVETLATDHRRAEWYVVVDEVWPRTHGATVTAYTDERQARSYPTPVHSGGTWCPAPRRNR